MLKPDLTHLDINNMSEETTTNWAEGLDNEDDLITSEPEKETETPEAPSANEETTEEETPSTEGEEQDEPPANTQVAEPLPWHKDPRWIEWQDDKKNLTSKVEELESRLNHPIESTEEIPNWFTKVYGDDPEIYAQYKEHHKQELAEIKQSAINELKAEEEKSKQELDRYRQEVEDGIAELKAEGHSFDENALKKIVLDEQLFDSNGKFNFRAGLKLMQTPVSNPAQEAKKQLAGKTAPTTGSTIPKKEFMTSDDLRGKTWRSFKG